MISHEPAPEQLYYKQLYYKGKLIMRSRIAILLTLLHLCQISPLAARAGEVRLSAAASMKDALQEIIATFTQTQPDVIIQPNLGASGALAKQIAQGAPADLFLSASREWLDFLIQNNRIAGQTMTIFAANRLVFVGPATTTAHSLADLPSLERIAMGSPQSVPAGNYARQAMEKAGVYDTLFDTGKLALTKDVRQALLYAERGEVDGAFVYHSDTKQTKNITILFSVPADHHEAIVYPFALTVDGERNKEARDFFTFCTSPAAKKILQKYGFTLPAGAGDRQQGDE